MVEFKDRFKQLRLEHRYSMAKAGELLGVSKSAIASWESGVKVPRTPIITEACELFGVSMDYILGTSNVKITKEQTRNLAILLSESNDFHYNGIPLSNEDLDLFNSILERMLKDAPPKQDQDLESENTIIESSEENHKKRA